MKAFALSLPVALALATWSYAAAEKPNIVIILADDMGYGDMKCNNPAGKIPTPNLDRLASDGVRFTDAHTPTSVCTPTRYALLTGRYAWRTSLKKGVLWQWDRPLIAPSRLTLPAMLQGHGYQTAAVGKWHLGMEWPMASPAVAKRLASPKNQDTATAADFDWSKPILGGPTARGFDYYFGVNCPNFAPYAFIENDRIVGLAPNTRVSAIGGRLSQHAGPSQAGFDRKQVAPTMAKKVCKWIETAAKNGKPFFLYFALTGPHSPIIPNDEFKGRSGIGDYGDWVMEMDFAVGQVVQTLRRSGVADNTLVIFTSDNGPETWNYEEARTYKHYAMGNLRGVKRDTWEGGHRVPFVAAWPGHIPAGTINAEVICHADLMATAAAIVGHELPPDAGEDSYNILPALTGQKLSGPIREATVHHGCDGTLAIRQGRWVYIDGKTGEISKEPDWFKRERGYDHAANKYPGVLYDLDADLAEHRNVYGDHPEIAARLKALLERYKRDGRSTPAAKAIVLRAPLDYQVIQRSTFREGVLRVEGHCRLRPDAVKIRIEGKTMDATPWNTDWLPAAVDSATGDFKLEHAMPAGGWYAVHVQAQRQGKPLAAADVAHVGVGEVFVGAGQSNSTNCGGLNSKSPRDGRTRPTSGMVAAFDGARWQIADDPQPGTHDHYANGSFWPAFGDAMAAKYKVPIGVAVTGQGATSIEAWRTDSVLFKWSLTRMRQLGPHGFRAVLWHQGEGDANTPAKAYADGLERIIRDFRTAAGWDMPWFVARASYCPGKPLNESGSRGGQKILCDRKIVFEGPDTDRMLGDLRDRDGKGVHFSKKGLKAHGEAWAAKLGAWMDGLPQDRAAKH